MAAAPGQKCAMAILTGNSHPELSNIIVQRLGVHVGDITVYHKSNRETNVEIKESVRGKDVFIIQTGTKDVNNDIMELLIIAYACKTSCARNIVGVIPYMPYSKQSKMRKRGSIIPDYRNAIIVARNPNSVRRATSFAERLRLPIAVIHGEAKIIDTDEEPEDGRNSPPLEAFMPKMQSFGLEMVPILQPKEKPPMNVVGDDDMIDDVQSYVAIAYVLKERGAYKVYVMATHGLLSSDAPRLIEDSCIDEVVVTNTVPHEIQKMQCHKIKTVDISIMLVEAIRIIQNNESMSFLFRNIAMDD
ncbi:hypothetical protein KUTeg_004343 [Tegillarca granosa]|uniref:Ribose-phosphate pyrophosphokinase N-terminal domain-containing protein n=1 Tax=Tegillarca granosa TaxID=220873 RepID=A0ABQ9FPN2_TEGGR|nr:hypothetical protein KUTeg_004343 [Tegillarca granosa]